MHSKAFATFNDEVKIPGASMILTYMRLVGGTRLPKQLTRLQCASGNQNPLYPRPVAGPAPVLTYQHCGCTGGGGRDFRARGLDISQDGDFKIGLEARWADPGQPWLSPSVFRATPRWCPLATAHLDLQRCQNCPYHPPQRTKGGETHDGNVGAGSDYKNRG